mgnify:CR=1 FL=1
MKNFLLQQTIEAAITVLYSGTIGIGIWEPINYYNGNIEVIRVRIPYDNNSSGCGKKSCENNIYIND